MFFLSPRSIAHLSAVGVVLMTSGCGGDVDSGTGMSARGPVTTIRVLRPPGKWVIDKPAWIPAPGVLTIAAATHPPYLDVTLFTVHVYGSGGWRQIPGLTRRDCKATGLYSPVALGRDQVAYTEDCFRRSRG